MTLSQFARRLQSAPVVMLFVNLPKRAEALADLEEVEEYSLDEKKHPTSPGVLVGEGKTMDLQSISSDLLRQGFVLIKGLVVARHRGMKRVVGVFVHKDHLKADSRPATKRVVMAITRLLDENFLDARVYRNPGPDGGNFVVETGRPCPVEGNSSLGDLRVRAEFEFVFDEEEVKSA